MTGRLVGPAAGSLVGAGIYLSGAVPTWATPWFVLVVIAVAWVAGWLQDAVRGRSVALVGVARRVVTPVPVCVAVGVSGLVSGLVPLGRFLGGLALVAAGVGVRWIVRRRRARVGEG